MDGKWRTHKHRDVYENEWCTVSLVDVELPDGTRIEHHAVRQPKSEEGGAGVLAVNEDGHVLLMWRHRFITDTWTWELPGGMVERNESPARAAEREMAEETGWRPGKLAKSITFQPMNGLIDHTFHCFTATSATFEGPGRDPNEAADIAWMSATEIRTAIDKGDVRDGITLTALLHAFAFGPLRSEG